MAYKRSTNIISFRCFSFISIRREWVHMDKYGPLIPPVISRRAKGPTDRGGAWRLGGRYNKAELVMHSDCGAAKMLGVC